MAQVDDAELRPGLALYRPLPTLLRLDVLPFGMLYATFSACAASAQRGHGFAVGLALVACTHALAFFASEWSLRVKCFVAYSRTSIAGLSLYDDVVVKVEPTSPSLPVELCLIQREAPSPKLQVQKVRSISVLLQRVMMFAGDNTGSHALVRLPKAALLPRHALDRASVLSSAHVPHHQHTCCVRWLQRVHVAHCARGCRPALAKERVSDPDARLLDAPQAAPRRAVLCLPGTTVLST